MKCEVFLSKKTDDWKTPSFIYEQVIQKGYYDPCPFQSQIDGLAMDWQEKNFVNPPYSQLKKWIEKSIEQHKKGKQIVLLIPARTDTKAFKLLFDYGSDIYLITGRLHYNDANTAPFPSMLCRLTHTQTKVFLIDRGEVKL